MTLARGLSWGPAQVFISDIRGASNKEQEKIRVDKELGKIRKKFSSNNSLSGAKASKEAQTVLLFQPMTYR